MTQEPKEVVVGKLTSMSGDILNYLNPKIVVPKNRFQDGSIFKFQNEKKFGLDLVEVPAGVSFEELINALDKEGYFPILFPIYLKGTVGGFISTNGSGFGSYKYGFVRSRVSLYELKDVHTANILVSKYSEVIELDQEVPFAWSGIIIDGVFKYYLPASYSSILHVKGPSISTKSVIEEISKISTSLLKRDYIPVCFRSTNWSLLNSAPMEKKIGYIINYNSPLRNYVLCGDIKYDELGQVFDFLKKNPSVLPFPGLQDYKEIHKTIMDKYKKEIRIPKNLEKYRLQFTEASKCINCGICLDTCLTYNTTKNVVYSPVGKFNRLLSGETNFEYCLGCKNDEDVCPVKIPISSLTTEFLPQISSSKQNISIQLENLPNRIKDLENMIESKYKNNPIFLLFVGCAYKYDPLGVEGFLDFIIENGNKIDKRFSPRIKLIDGMCCGFDKYMSGNIEGAKLDVNKILELKQRLNASGIYFLCPEGLYVYNSLSKDKGVLAFEVVKPFLNGKIHAGCWARKLGIDGDDKECAGLFLTSYQDSEIPLNRKDNVLTICPFSTWKFSSKSVYSNFLKAIQAIPTSMLIDNYSSLQVSDQVLLDIVKKSLIQSVNESVDDIADKLANWVMGGSNYFMLLIIPIIRKKFVEIFKSTIRKNSDLLNYIKFMSKNQVLMNDKIDKISSAASSIDYYDVVNDLIPKISTSSKLEYDARNIVNDDRFKSVMNEVIKKIVTSRILSDIFNEISFSK
ncbi:FAD-binding protein [Acidianus sulfidivorans JP7]|uniref:4Fe-4S ferredoxin n=1 Tax=Acidianus sulfidivorans JP7 TaxID=619593 RepID=A0A2U9IKS9_9CREN|nr:FAD-binding protein [Acidianus sulfidivorans]AWR96648.1 FAD-binding protein [Acidianus sulfidivorans JP7]